MFPLLPLLFALAAHTRPEMVVSTEWLATNIGNPHVRVLDVSSPEEYTQGHIAGAVFLNVKRLMVRRDGIPNELPSVTELEELFRDAGVKGNDRLILTSDDPLLAARAYFTLDYLGWGAHAAILDGGNAKWAAERHAVNTVITPAERSDFTAFIDRSAIISRDRLKTLMASGDPVVVLDARDPQHYLGRLKGLEVDRAGHIPHADCFPAMSNLRKSGSARVLREPEQLRQMYASLKVTSADQRIIVYCRSGVEASMNYFILSYLGFRPALYDGSFVEWNKSEPVESAAR
jgi:thiosulfate/3-mercaptopyruvate sulfurtransferase